MEVGLGGGGGERMVGGSSERGMGEKLEKQHGTQA